eukprot:TRINITY_DN16827_c0_g1_i1.p1 TRINITY_DN16827_c0_g1~~TRINITY_DN16827_c0_g1_i1.p1  ORF type:complete len:413 (+),score=131.60 TRINITY_DN16827_c0_g1_i1:49-1287(+)
MGGGEDVISARLNAALAKRRERGVLRALSPRTGPGGRRLVDFCSNDYLGIARDAQVVRAVAEEYAAAAKATEVEGAVLGSAGSRLLSGNNAYAEALERKVARVHGQDAALLFSTGWLANFSVLACIPAPEDVVLYDALCHNSVREGIKYGRQKAACAFAHNSVDALSAALRAVLPTLSAGGTAIVVVESVYSMEGDVAPLKAMCDVVAAIGGGRAKLIVDEAHGAGLLGPNGRGVVARDGVAAHPALLCAVYTYGKAFGAHGAAVVGQGLLKEYLLNYARPLIYSTAMSLHSLVTISCAYDALLAADDSRAHLQALIVLFVSELSPPRLPRGALLESPSPIQAVLVPGSRACLGAAAALRAEGYDVLAVRAPTVPEGAERLRVILHAHNTRAEVLGLTALIRRVRTAPVPKL